MKVGIALNMLCQAGRSDASVVGEHLALGDLAEPLGFDSLFALEHHFTGYAMSPAPTQLLSYFAGRTKRIHLGTAVIVLPWHDPVRRRRGDRAARHVVRRALPVRLWARRRQRRIRRLPHPDGRGAAALCRGGADRRQGAEPGSFEHQGEFFQIPRTAIRPRPISHPERRFHASAVSPDSAEIMAKLGFGILMVMQNEWPKAAEQIVEYRHIATAAGHTPRPPIILTNVCCSESRDEAHAARRQYLGQKWQSIDDHYHFSDGHLATVKGYESYGKMAKTYAKIGESAETRQKATDFYVSIQIVGTPKDCLDKIAELQRLTGLDHLVTEFSFGAMPHEEAEVNMRLFADKVLPTLQRDPAFAGGDAPQLAMLPDAIARERVFAPA